ncbi:MAG: HNH endonuclease [Nitrospirae bacterium]|nr:HNH endonuclease [Nitrospirota bacterium]
MKHPSLPDRFWSKVAKGPPEDCWLWMGARLLTGYGVFSLGGSDGAHRVAWMLTHGPIPPGRHICHHCDNPPCCNPAHLFCGTHLDNMRDRDRKGRGNHYHPPRSGTGPGHQLSPKGATMKMLTVPVEDSLKRELDKLRQEGYTLNGWVRATLAKALKARKQQSATK